jgi:hypothetical protein
MIASRLAAARESSRSVIGFPLSRENPMCIRTPSVLDLGVVLTLLAHMGRPVLWRSLS